MMQYTARIDRPLGTRHPKHPDIVYPVNYGYIPGIIGGDGEEQDVYILGVAEPLDVFTGELIAIIRRSDDVEDKWVLAPEGMRFTAGEIMAAVHFQEQYFDSVCVMDDRPLTYVWADASNRELTREMVLTYLRDLHRDPPGRQYSDDINEGVRYFVEEMDKAMVIVLDGERPVACAALGEHRTSRRLDRQTGGKCASLMYVYAARKYRSSHVIRRMILLLHREARKRGIREIDMHMPEASETTCAVCRELGYSEPDDYDFMFYEMK